jgi:glycosyltransferase involved in cell wall biosynthesis
MRIGVDLCDMNPGYGGGSATFAFGLISGLIAAQDADDRLVLLVTDRNEAFLRESFEGRNVGFLNVRVRRWSWVVNAIMGMAAWSIGNFKLRLWYDRLLRHALMREIDDAMDVLVAPLSVLRFYGMKVPSLVCIHDIQQEFHPENFTWVERVRRWDRYRLSAWRAATVQASSQYIKDCLLEKFSFLMPAKIAIVPEGVDLGRFSMDASCEPPPSPPDLRSGAFVFYPAQIWPHKNHLMLVDALARYRDRSASEMTCVLTGRDYGQWATVRERIDFHQLRSVHYLGLVPFDQLAWLYRNCAAVLALGMHESSSLPAREGAAFGKILICLDIPPNREASADFRIELVKDADPDDLARTLMAVTNNEEDLVGSSRENAELARRFDWKNIAREYRRILRSMAENG